MNLLEKARKKNFNIHVIWAYIKRYFKGYVIKTMCYAGFYVEDLPNAVSFYLKSKNDPVAIRENELRKFTLFLKKANNLILYGQILQKFVPQMDMVFSHTKFTSAGGGSYNLNTFRKVTFNGDVFFEKVNFNSSIEVDRLNWFYNNIYFRLNNNIKVPPLCCSYRGDLITIFYFEFIKLVSLADKDVGTYVFSLSRELYMLSKLAEVKDIVDNAPVFLKDYKIYFEYERNIEKAQKRASEILENGFPFQEIEEIISLSSIVLTHGDVHQGNVFSNNILIDWDTFGLYPIGLEVAYILLFWGKSKLDYRDLNQILEREYRATILEEEWNDFQLNCLYFYYVFTINSSIDLGSSEIQIDILNRILELYYIKSN